MAAEAELWARARAGDKRARARLVDRHLPLARAVAARFGAAGPGRDDLLQAAALGLVEAVAAFDPDRGTSFSTFAVPRILGEVRDALRRHSGLGGSRALVARAARLRVVQGRLRQTLGREPAAGDLCAALGWSRSELAEVAGALEPALSFDAAAAELPPRLARSPEAEVVDRLALASAMATLPPLERRVIALRYIGRLSQRQVADVVGVGQSQVSRRERRGLRRLWRSLGGRSGIHTPPGREAT